MTSGFVNIWVEKRGDRFFTIVETGDGRRTTSPPFRTQLAANARAQKALLSITNLHPEAEVMARDERSETKPARSAPGLQAESDARHKEPQA